MCKVMIKKQSCGCEGFQELRVAFGSMDNCQLKCVFCFTREQQSSNERLSDFGHMSLEDVKIIRFTGGEPLMFQNQIDGIVRELSAREDTIKEYVNLVVVQTNAIGIGERSLKEFSRLQVPLLFEVSFKGTNVAEYQYLTFENPTSSGSAESVLSKQVEGYRHLAKVFADNENIAVLARLGIFHSSLNSPTFKFTYPSNEGALMFAPSRWDKRFYDIWFDQKAIWGETFEGKMVVEKLKTPADGSPGIGRRYRAIIDHLKSKGLLLEDTRKSAIPQEFRERYYYRKGDEIYKAAEDSVRNL